MTDDSNKYEIAHLAEPFQQFLAQIKAMQESEENAVEAIGQFYPHDLSAKRHVEDIIIGYLGATGSRKLARAYHDFLRNIDRSKDAKLLTIDKIMEVFQARMQQGMRPFDHLELSESKERWVFTLRYGDEPRCYQVEMIEIGRVSFEQAMAFRQFVNSHDT